MNLDIEMLRLQAYFYFAFKNFANELNMTNKVKIMFLPLPMLI
jgi:hypothetical protein